MFDCLMPYAESYSIYFLFAKFQLNLVLYPTGIKYSRALVLTAPLKT